jgi:hypothetical protein
MELYSGSNGSSDRTLASCLQENHLGLWTCSNASSCFQCPSPADITFSTEPNEDFSFPSSKTIFKGFPTCKGRYTIPPVYWTWLVVLIWFIGPVLAFLLDSQRQAIFSGVAGRISVDHPIVPPCSSYRKAANVENREMSLPTLIRLLLLHPTSCSNIQRRLLPLAANLRVFPIANIGGTIS